MENIKLFNGDCLEVMKEIEPGSVDLVFCDLPYGITSCAWDIKIDLEKFWKEINRITKETTPIFFTTTTKFGVELIVSNPKNFRYDLVWVKSASCGFMNAKKMPMRKHEMIYVFYRKLPLYDLSSHSHKFLKDSVIQIRGKDKAVKEDVYNADERFISGKLYHYPRQLQKGDESVYDPPLPNSVIRDTTDYTNNSELYGIIDRPDFMRKDGESVYDPPLPNSILEIKSRKGKHSTQKPVDLINWILKYYSKEGDVVLDPTMGSGSTGIACKGMNRKFIGIELCEDIFIKAKENICGDVPARR